MDPSSDIEESLDFDNQRAPMSNYSLSPSPGLWRENSNEVDEHESYVEPAWLTGYGESDDDNDSERVEINEETQHGDSYPLLPDVTESQFDPDAENNLPRARNCLDFTALNRISVWCLSFCTPSLASQLSRPRSCAASSCASIPVTWLTPSELRVCRG
ncbi:hypothetical protein K491DRAFT_454627 [Lophiostoma macrostomum CBS 122681]|uniref:Uncharacterized protein n=1 Tax=Lophiostoma macrostomum CBS 122681 TaxID=1314788 RepID=A0A6A6T6C2_9PLEO|nr:hypothetical protein K491DRAFT_454627 [Lophiostoma macrostomum CBS 122681]